LHNPLPSAGHAAKRFTASHWCQHVRTAQFLFNRREAVKNRSADRSNRCAFLAILQAKTTTHFIDLGPLQVGDFARSAARQGKEPNAGYALCSLRSLLGVGESLAELAIFLWS